MKRERPGFFLQRESLLFNYWNRGARREIGSDPQLVRISISPGVCPGPLPFVPRARKLIPSDAWLVCTEKCTSGNGHLTIVLRLSAPNEHCTSSDRADPIYIPASHGWGPTVAPRVLAWLALCMSLSPLYDCPAVCMCMRMCTLYPAAHTLL